MSRCVVCVHVLTSLLGPNQNQNRNPGNVVPCVCAHVCVCECEAPVKVAPASSCVSGRIDHLIQIKDSPSARGRDELVTQCKIETYGCCRALVSGQELLCPHILPLTCFCHSSG